MAWRSMGLQVQHCLVVTNSHLKAHPCAMEPWAWGGKASASPFTSCVAFLLILHGSIQGQWGKGHRGGVACKKRGKLGRYFAS